jgi:hypothetical protein
MAEDRGFSSSLLSRGDRRRISTGRHSVRWQPITPAAGGAMAHGMNGAPTEAALRTAPRRRDLAAYGGSGTLTAKARDDRRLPRKEKL